MGAHQWERLIVIPACKNVNEAGSQLHDAVHGRLIIPSNVNRRPVGSVYIILSCCMMQRDS